MQQLELIATSHTFDVAGTAVTVSAATDAVITIRTEMESSPAGTDSHVIRLILASSQERFNLSGLTIEWAVPVIGMHGFYFGGNPRETMSHLPFWQVAKTVGANRGVPFAALIDRENKNRFAFGLANQLTETHFRAYLSEMTGCYHFTVTRPVTEGEGDSFIPVTGRWVETIFISTQRRSWPEVLRVYAGLVDATMGNRQLPVPDAAYAPVFCTWYAIHHDVNDAWSRRQAAIAADLGFGTWITDDGWFIERGDFADYSLVGAWEPYPDKFPDFRAHVAAIQELGLRYLLWVSPFMVGTGSTAHDRYRHLLIPGQERERFDNLSPWEPDTAEIVRNLLVRLVTEYGLDGLKIDFLDSVRDYQGRSAGALGESFGERFYRIMAGAMDAVEDVHPGILIEFRNSYSNLASRRYANLYRSSDVPFNALLNRWQAVMLRLLALGVAVHLDPVIWHPDESDEDVAVHLINGIASVPTISIDLERYPERHLQLIRHWLGFYNRHRRTLVHGDFNPVLRLGHVPSIVFSSDEETIIALYDDVPVAIEPAPRLWLINASTRPYLDVSDCALGGTRRAVERDKFGQVVAEREMDFPQARLAVEIGGTLEIVPG
jgi:alpha-galactosidase